MKIRGLSRLVLGGGIKRKNAEMVGAPRSANLFRYHQGLLRVQLDDQLFVDLLRNLIPLRIGQEDARHFIGVPFQPAKFAYVAVFGANVRRDDFEALGTTANRNHIAGFQRVGRYVDYFAIDGNMAMAYQDRKSVV